MWIFSSICGPMSHDFLSQHSTFPPKFQPGSLWLASNKAMDLIFPLNRGSFTETKFLRHVVEQISSYTLLTVGSDLCIRVRMCLVRVATTRCALSNFSRERAMAIQSLCAPKIELNISPWVICRISHLSCLKPTQKTLSLGAASVVYLVSRV